jgi:hypothetical protein
MFLWGAECTACCTVMIAMVEYLSYLKSGFSVHQLVYNLI